MDVGQSLCFSSTFGLCPLVLHPSINSSTFGLGPSRLFPPHHGLMFVREKVELLQCIH